VASEFQRVAKRPTDNFEAYDLYVRGRALWNEHLNSAHAEAALDTVAGMFRRAIALDPSFAAAHAALARVYVSRLFLQGPSGDLRERAKSEIARALTLDSSSAEAYFARGDLAYTREEGWRLDDAMRDYRRSLALKPNYADVHAVLGSLLFHIGILEEAQQELETALALDPANQFVPPRIGRVLWYRQRYDSALDLDRRQPGSLFPYERAMVLGYLGRPEEGLALLDSVWGGQRAHGRSRRGIALAAAHDERRDARLRVDRRRPDLRRDARGFGLQGVHENRTHPAPAVARDSPRDRRVETVQRGRIGQRPTDGQICMPLRLSTST
jgi:hypothetical protein